MEILNKIGSTLGTKVLLIILSSVFLYIGKIDQSTWEMIVLTIAGFRTLNQAIDIAKNSNNGSRINGRSKQSITSKKDRL